MIQRKPESRSNKNRSRTDSSVVRYVRRLDQIPQLSDGEKSRLGGGC